VLTFRAPHPSLDPPATHGPSPIDIRNVDVTGLRVDSHVHGLPGLVVTDLRATVDVWIPHDDCPPRLTARRVTGSMRIASPMPVTLVMSSGALTFDGASRDRAEIDVGARIDGIHVRSRTTVTDRREGMHVASLLVLPDAFAALRETALIAEASAAEAVKPGFDFSVRIAP